MVKTHKKNEELVREVADKYEYCYTWYERKKHKIQTLKGKRRNEISERLAEELE